MNPPFPRFPSAKGFSLIELLVVIAVIGTLGGLAVVGFGDITRGSGARGASDLAASLALAARIEAMAHGRGAMLFIDNGTNPATRWQKMGIVRFTNATDYELAGPLVTLPKGIFFLPSHSSPGLISTNLSGLPGNVSSEVLAIRFDGSGHIGAPVFADLVFAPNVMDASGNLVNPPDLLTARQGFKLRRNGRPAYFTSPDQMPPNP